jgi:hypothetical protein
MISSAECLSHSVEYARWARETGQKEAQCAIRTMAKLLRGKMQPEMDSVGKGKGKPGAAQKRNKGTAETSAGTQIRLAANGRDGLA